MLYHSSCRAWGRQILHTALILLFILLLSGAAAEENRVLSFRQMAEPIKGAVSVFEEKSTKSREIARLEKGEQCEVIGIADPYYRVRIGDQTGYASQSRLTVQTVQASVPEAICGTVSLLTATPGRHEEYLLLQGTVTADGSSFVKENLHFFQFATLCFYRDPVGTMRLWHSWPDFP